VIEIGRDLRAVQQQLKDSRQFCDWVTAECGFSLSSAYNYIDASKLADKLPTVGNLNPRTLYALARKSTPLAIVDQVINRSSNGDVVPFVDVKRMLDTAREHKREADRKEKEAARRRRLTMKGREKEDVRRVERESERARAEEAARANARSITERFGSEGVTFLLSIRWELGSALDVLDYERTHEGKAASP
jgi:hypothetical protein